MNIDNTSSSMIATFWIQSVLCWTIIIVCAKTAPSQVQEKLQGKRIDWANLPSGCVSLTQNFKVNSFVYCFFKLNNFQLKTFLISERLSPYYAYTCPLREVLLFQRKMILLFRPCLYLSLFKLFHYAMDFRPSFIIVSFSFFFLYLIYSQERNLTIVPAGTAPDKNKSANL